MDPRLLNHYNQELQFLREMGGEFAREFPKIAARLDMKGDEVADPYVERLLEGASFLAARVQLKIEAEFPRFTQQLLEMVYPHYLAPTPSMLIAQFQPESGDTNLARGVSLPKGTPFRSMRTLPGGVSCEFRTADELRLWPLEIGNARYFSAAPDLPLAKLPLTGRVKGGVRFSLNTLAGLDFQQLALETLRVHLGGTQETAYKLYELIGASLLGAVVCPVTESASPPWFEFLPPRNVSLTGFDDEQALLPVKHRGFGAYRLLQEYFALPERFLFLDVSGLSKALSQHTGRAFEVVLLFGQAAPVLESLVSAENFQLHCCPAINLFPKRLDRISVSDAQYEFHAVPDRTHPLDYEVYEITSVVGHSAGAETERSFLPFYADFHSAHEGGQAYFSTRREPRLISDKQRRNGTRTGYLGSEVFLSLVDVKEAPYRGDLRRLSVQALCTNRDLPILMHQGGSGSDFVLDTAAPVQAIRLVGGPSRPYSMLAEGAVAWRLISQLSLNYFSLLDGSGEEGASALREMLTLYAATGEAGLRHQIEGVRSVRASSVVRRLPMPGPICFGRGLEIGLELDEMAFEGGGAFLFGNVLNHFFARHASLNSFTQTILRSLTRGQIMKWEPRCGTKPIF